MTRVPRSRYSAKSPGILLLLATLAILTVPGCGNDSLDANAPGTGCLSTPAQYQSAWNDYRRGYVDPRLCGTAPFDVAADRLYPPAYAYAWANGSTNLEAYLNLRSRYGNPASPFYDPIKTIMGIESFTGFPLSAADNQCNNPLTGATVVRSTLFGIS